MKVVIKDDYEDLESPEELYQSLKNRLPYTRECYDYMFDHIARLYEGRATRIIDIRCIFIECKNDEEINDGFCYLKEKGAVYKEVALKNGNVLFCDYVAN